jgi:hypothetical protein
VKIVRTWTVATQARVTDKHTIAYVHTREREREIERERDRDNTAAGQRLA